MKPSGTPHILLDDQGRAWVDDTNTKVIEIVLARLGWAATPEQIHEELPHLSLAQVHAALAYYHDHKVEFDAEIQRQLQYVDEQRAQSADSPRRKRLQQLKEERAGGAAPLL